MASSRKTTVQRNATALRAAGVKPALKVPTRAAAGIKPDAKLTDAKVNNLHKLHPKGWDSTFAFELSVEYANRVKEMGKVSAEQAMKLMQEYVPFTGWKNPVKALASIYGLTKYEPRAAKSA